MMATELDLDDAVGNVTGDLARRELDKLLRERDETIRVLKGMVEYSECNDPGNPWLNEARAVLRDRDADIGGET